MPRGRRTTVDIAAEYAREYSRWRNSGSPAPPTAEPSGDPDRYHWIPFSRHGREFDILADIQADASDVMNHASYWIDELDRGRSIDAMNSGTVLAIAEHHHEIPDNQIFDRDAFAAVDCNPQPAQVEVITEPRETPRDHVWTEWNENGRMFEICVSSTARPERIVESIRRCISDLDAGYYISGDDLVSSIREIPTRDNQAYVDTVRAEPQSPNLRSYQDIHGNTVQREYESRVRCHYCDRRLTIGSDNIYYIADWNICSRCLDVYYRCCNWCNHWFPMDSLLNGLHNDHYCDDCFGEAHIICPECEEIENLNYSCRYHVRDENNEMIDEILHMCSRCFDRSYRICRGCRCIGDLPDMIAANDGYYYHADCYEAIDNMNVNGYDFVPHYEKRGVSCPQNKTERISRETLLLGIELEIENESQKHTGKLFKNDTAIAETLADWMYPKHDGTLQNGFEIVTHPATWAFIRKNKAAWDDVFDLREHGFRSYTPKTCGMHVHLSKASFSTLHLFKFMKLFYEAPGFIQKFSRRGRAELNQWASLTADSNIYYKAKDKGYNERYKYTAVNLSHDATVEVRVFRGTLDPEAFWANVEFCVAAFYFTKEATIPMSDDYNFRKWVTAHRDEYPNLCEMFHRLGMM